MQQQDNSKPINGGSCQKEYIQFSSQLFTNTNLPSNTMTSQQNSQGQQSQISNKPKCNRKKVYLSQEQTEALVLSWREKGFGDFNNWIQSAKAEQNVDFIENPLEVGVRTFTCKLEIYFPNYSNIPNFSSVGNGRSKKEAKKIAQERILLDIIKDGYLSLGYKDDSFLDKIPRLADVHQMIISNTKTGRPDLNLVDQIQLDATTTNQAYTLDVQNRQILQSKQVPPTQNEINAFYQDISLSGLDKINPLNSPLTTNTMSSSNTLALNQSAQSHISFYPNDKNANSKEKEELQKKIFKLSKQMQENLKQDKYFEACQILVQILSKKSPEWNEINHIWSYALLSKDIVYIKVLIDLIIQKAITKPKVEFIFSFFIIKLITHYIYEFMKEADKGSQKKDETICLGQQKQEDESIEQAKRELIKKYGNNIQWVETDNVYDYFDSYTLMVNKSDIENQSSQTAKSQTEEEDQECIVSDLTQQTHLQQLIEAQLGDQQPINEIIAPFDSQIKSMEKREVLKEIDNLKKQILYYQSLQNLDQNVNNNLNIQNSVHFIQQKLNEQGNDITQGEQSNDQDNNIAGEFPTKKIKLNEEQSELSIQENKVSQSQQDPQKIQEYSDKIEELQQQIKKKEKELEEIDKQYQEYLKLQDQRKKQLEDQQEQQRQHEQQIMQQRNPKLTTPLNSYYIPQQQQQPGIQQYPPYMPQQQQQTFQYPTMAYNHYDYTMQNSAIFQQQQYYNQYYYNQHAGYPYMQYPYANQPGMPYPAPPMHTPPTPSTSQYPASTYPNYQQQQQQQPYNQMQPQQQQPLLQDQKISQTQSQLSSTNKNESSLDQSPLLEKINQLDQNINYLKYNLVDEMYDSLLYLGDMNFSLAVAEQIYSKVKLNVQEFQNIQAAHYYSNKKNMLVVELIEYIFQVFNSSKPRLNEAFASINGSIQKIGNKEVLLFNPASTETNLDQKIAKKGLLEQRENYSLIAEGEFVMLTSLQQSNNNDHSNLYSDLRSSQSRQYLIQFLNNIANNLHIQPPDVRAFYNKISENGQPIEFAIIGYVREISKESAIKLFILPTPHQSRAISDSYRVWKITKLVNKTTYDRTCEALLKFVGTKSVSEPIMNIILTPPICDKQKIQEMSEKIVFTPSKNTLFIPSLNHSQQTALQYATTRALTLIQGPPGTGKTTTAVHIVQEWCRQSSDPILACADSNIAVDILHKEFVKSGIRACRIGPGSESKNELMQDPKYRTYIESFKKQQSGKNPISAKFMFMKKLIAESQVVCATNVGSMSEYLKESNFTRVIIDEATQATEMSTIIPLINKAQQVVLIGDHKQLPPTVLSSLAQSKGMTISLFERLVKQGVQPKMLMRQYRMHSTISLFPSHQFYNNLLENGVSDQQRLPIEGFIWPNKLLRIAFINLNGEERVSQSSVLNYSEVQVVTEIIVDVLKTKKISLQQIGVITPYDAQKRRIKTELTNLSRANPQMFGQVYQNDFKSSKYQNSQIEVDTIDGYQGMEKDLIIISTVRSNNKGSIGFLKDPRRMNVALTRAKRGLIIVGNINTLQKDSNWRDFITWVNANKAVIQYGVNTITQNQNMNKMMLSSNQS